MPDDEDLIEFASAESERKIQAQLDQAKAELRGARATISSQQRQIDALDRVAEASKRDLKPPKWTTRRVPKSVEKTGTICTILSDTHFDEIVNPSEVDFRNAYDREIATFRLERYFRGVILLARQYLTGSVHQGVVLMLGGDLISGDIHEELTESNEAGNIETCLYWTEQIAAGIKLLNDEFGQVHVPCVVGNHGRRTRRPRMKGRTRDNFDWLIYQMLAKQFSDVETVTFQIPDSTDALVQVYDTTFLLTHGDQVSGGGGIGGIWPPIMRMIAKKRVRHGFDTLVCGHWHQLIMAPTAGLIVNGSLKGEDEFAAIMNFTPERAQQAMWITTPENGVTFSAPVFCDDPDSEGWK